MAECSQCARGVMPGARASWRSDGDSKGLEVGMVRISLDGLWGEARVGRHRACSLAKTRESGTGPQAPRRRVNSQMDDGV